MIKSFAQISLLVVNSVYLFVENSYTYNSFFEDNGGGIMIDDFS